MLKMRGEFLKMQLKEDSTVNQACEGVLIIDDEKDIRESLQQIMEFEGYSTQIAKNGQEGLKVLSELPVPQLILLDLMMPVMNGWEFVEALRADSKLSVCPVIVISAFAEKAKSMPTQAVIKKPINLDEMMNFVEKYVPKKAAG